MAARIEAYVDTSALIAFLDRSDSYHPVFSRLFADPPALVSSSLVVAEGHGWFLRRYDAVRAMQFLSFVEELDTLFIAAIGSAEIRAAWNYLRKYSDQSLTLADAAGLFLMKVHKVKRCWSTDRHLGLSGVPLVIDANSDQA